MVPIANKQPIHKMDDGYFSVADVIHLSLMTITPANWTEGLD